MRGHGSEEELQRFRDLRSQHRAYVRVRSRNEFRPREKDVEIEYPGYLSEEVEELEKLREQRNMYRVFFWRAQE